MELVQIYYGEGRGKSKAALGSAIQMASQGKTAIIIQFLKEKNEDEYGYIERLEPELKMFRFEKAKEKYADLTPEEKKDEAVNIRNGINYAKKVLSTGECDLLILDEILGLLDEEIITEEELCKMFDNRSESTRVILTGTNIVDSVKNIADAVYNVQVDN